MESVKTEKFKFKLGKFLELIPDEPKITNYDIAARGNSILYQLSHRSAHGIYQGSARSIRPGHGAGLTTSKLLLVFQVSIITLKIRDSQYFTRNYSKICK